jgi:regulator of RNase E activity RraA
LTFAAADNRLHFLATGGARRQNYLTGPVEALFASEVIAMVADRSLLARLLIAFVLTCFGAFRVAAQPADDPEVLRAGRSFIKTKAYSAQEDRKIVEQFDGLRVADISDGMDQAGLADVGLVSADIGPLWRDTRRFTHRIIGVAVTARYVPTNDPRPPAESAEKFDAWVGETYDNVTSEPFVPLLREGSVLVIEEAEDADVGSIGSNNIMTWKLRGCVGVVTSATARDTDEIAAQKIPLYFKKPGRGIRPGRNEIESVNRPVVVGGVQVQPGDVIAADGDGVIVVPRKYAEQVARYAHATLEKDKAARRELYKRLNLPEDDSVR